MLDNWPTSSSALADLEMDQFSQVIADPIALSLYNILLRVWVVVLAKVIEKYNLYAWLTVLKLEVYELRCYTTILWFSTTGHHLQSFSHNKIYKG